MSQCTPLDFMSNYSVKSSDTLSHLFRDMQDEIEGDVGQEGEIKLKHFSVCFECALL